MKKIAIIGGGMSGLTAAYELSKRGHDVTLFEKENYIGGRTHSIKLASDQINTGAVFYVNFYPRFQKYLLELGLDQDHFEMNHDVNFMHGAQHHLYKMSSPLAVLRLPEISLWEKLRLCYLGLTILTKKHKLSLVDPNVLAKGDTLSISSFVEQKLSKNVLEKFIRATLEPYYYWSTNSVSKALFEVLLAYGATAKFFTLRDGMDALAKALSAKISSVKCGESVTRLAVNEDGKISVFTDRSSDEFDQIVVAATSSVAYKLTHQLAIVDEQQKQFLSSQKYSSNVNVSFWVESKYTSKIPTHNQPTAQHLKDTAAIVVQGLRTKEAIEANQKMEKVVVYFLDDQSKLLISQPDEEVCQAAFKSIQSFFPQIENYKSMIHIARHQEAIPIPEVGRFKLASEFINSQKSPIVFAGDYLSTSCIEGAIFSGQQAADLLQ